MKTKDDYVKPQIVVIEAECNTMLAASKLGYTDEEADKDLEVLSNKRRGKWGDLWANK